MREIVLDTETTGLDPDSGDRIVEIGAVELLGHVPNGNSYHQYVNPEREVPKEAVDVHGLTADFLRDKPAFGAIAQDFLAFIGDAKLVIHNAAFDLKFLNAELRWLDLPQIDEGRAIDTLEIARRKFPGAPASLDALCRRFGIDNSKRTLHGALLDSEILAELYLELIGGRQPDLLLAVRDEAKDAVETDERWRPGPRPTQLGSRVTPEEERAHAELVARLGEDSVWQRLS